jgi:hypothetical protein
VTIGYYPRYRVVVASVDVSAEFSNGSRVVGTATLGQVCATARPHRHRRDGTSPCHPRPILIHRSLPVDHAAMVPVQPELPR